MPINKSESTKIVKLDLNDLSDDQKERAKRIAGEIIVDSINEYLDDGVSPVSGKGRFKRLSKKYADEFKGGDTSPDLFLDGEMREAITFEPHKDGVKVGVFKSANELERLKASGHNRGDSANKTQRQFIPFPKGDFKSEILREVNDAISELKRGADSTETREGIASLETVFSDESLDSLILGLINGQN